MDALVSVMDRRLYYQFVDVLIAGAVAALVAFLLAAVVPRLATSVAVILASMYYFSRNPWGSQRGEEYNEAIDDVYDRFLPGG